MIGEFWISKRNQHGSIYNEGRPLKTCWYRILKDEAGEGEHSKGITAGVNMCWIKQKSRLQEKKTTWPDVRWLCIHMAKLEYGR